MLTCFALTSLHAAAASIAIALTAALSTPALAVPGARPDYHRYVQSEEQHQKQSQAGNRQNNDPYWNPATTPT